MREREREGAKLSQLWDEHNKLEDKCWTFNLMQVKALFSKDDEDVGTMVPTTKWTEPLRDVGYVDNHFPRTNPANPIY